MTGQGPVIPNENKGDKEDFSLRSKRQLFLTFSAIAGENPKRVSTIREALRGIDLARDPANQDKIIPYVAEDFQLDPKNA